MHLYTLVWKSFALAAATSILMYDHCGAAPTTLSANPHIHTQTTSVQLSCWRPYGSFQLLAQWTDASCMDLNWTSKSTQLLGRCAISFNLHDFLHFSSHFSQICRNKHTLTRCAAIQIHMHRSNFSQQFLLLLFHTSVYVMLLLVHTTFTMCVCVCACVAVAISFRLLIRLYSS